MDSMSQHVRWRAVGNFAAGDQTERDQASQGCWERGATLETALARNFPAGRPVAGRSQLLRLWQRLQFIQLPPCLRPVRTHPLRRLKMGNRFGSTSTNCCQGHSEIELRVGIIGFDPQCRFKLGDHIGQASGDPCQGDAHVIVRFGKGRIDPQCSPVLGDRLGYPVLVGVETTEVEMGPIIVRRPSARPRGGRLAWAQEWRRIRRL